MKIVIMIFLIFSANAFAQMSPELTRFFAQKRYDEVMRIAQPMAEQGEDKAQFALGMLYAYGFGVANNAAEGLKWIQLAADNGNIGGQNMLGLWYFKGQIVNRDYSKSFFWKKKVADSHHAGYPGPVFDVAEMYMDGIGIPRDVNEAKKYYEMFIVSARPGMPQEMENANKARARINAINTPSSTESRTTGITTRLDTVNAAEDNLTKMRRELEELKLRKEIDNLKRQQQESSKSENYRESLKLAIAKCINEAKRPTCKLSCFDPNSTTFQMTPGCADTCEDREQARIVACQNMK